MGHDGICLLIVAAQLDQGFPDHGKNEGRLSDDDRDVDQANGKDRSDADAMDFFRPPQDIFYQAHILVENMLGFINTVLVVSMLSCTIAVSLLVHGIDRI